MKLSLLRRYAVALMLCPAPAFAGTLTGQVQTTTGGAIANATINLRLSQAAIVAGSAAVAPVTVACYTSSSGQVVGAPDPQVLPTVSATSTMSALPSGGVLPAGLYFVRITYTSADGESLPSPELQVQLTATGAIGVNAPALQPSGATGYNVYIGTAANAETLQATQVGWNPYMQTTALQTGAPLPQGNTTSCSFRFSDEMIPTGTHYKVSLTNARGSLIAGYPQNWCTYGGTNGHIDLSFGTPTGGSCGVAGVVYPTPILSTPPGGPGAPQSINGNLDLGMHTLNVGAITGLGSLTSGSVNGTLNAAQFPGADIGVKVNAAIATLVGSHGRVYIPAGVYQFATRISLPRGVLLDGAGPASTSLVWTGAGVAVYSGDSGAPFAAQFGGISNLELTALGTRPAGTIAIFSGGDPAGVISPVTDNAQSQTFINLHIDNFDIAFEHGNNSFWLSFVAPRISANNIGFTVAPSSTDSGESINFFGGAIDDNLQGAFVNDMLDNHLYGVGIDFNGNLGDVAQITNSVISADRCNWEVHTGAMFSGGFLKILGGQMLIDQSLPAVPAMIVANQLENQISISDLNISSAAPVANFLSWSNGADPYSLLALTNLTGNHNGLIAALYDNLPANQDVDIRTALGPVRSGITITNRIPTFVNGLTTKGGATWTTGTDAPSGACSSGSLFTRTDATGGLYVCVNSAWVGSTLP